MAARQSMAPPKKGAPAHPALLQPPFFVVDGISPSAPVSQQMEQIDQMNTLLLQDIDYNFARFHETITARVLPAIKRFALASEPTREAAEFWRAFFEQAAGTRLAVEQDADEPDEPDHTVYDDQTVSLAHDSFNPATSSTPARRAPAPDDSLEDSVGSPFEHMDRRLGSLAISDEDTADTPSLPSAYGRYDDSVASPLRAAPARSNSTLAPGPGTPGRRGSALIDLAQTPLNARFDSFSPSPAMSPPVTMKFTLPPRAEAMVRPAREPSAREYDGKDTKEMTTLLDEITAYDYAPSPRAATPEALRRYSVMPGEIGRRLFDDDTPKASASGSAAGSGSRAGEASGSGSRPGSVFGSGSRAGEGSGSGSQLGSVFGSGSRAGEGSAYSSGSRAGEGSSHSLASKPGNIFGAPPPSSRPEDDSLSSSLGFGRPPTSTYQYTSAGDESVNLLGDTTLEPTPRRRSLANTSFGSDIQASDEPVRVIGDDESIDESFDDTFDATGATGHYYGYQPAAPAAHGGAYDAQAAAHAGFEFDDDSYVSDDGDTQRIGGAQGTGLSEVFGRPAGDHGEFRLHQQDEMLTYHGGRLEDAAPTASPTRRRD